MEAEVELRIWDQLKKEWILIYKRKLDRINRIIGIKRPCPKGLLAEGENIPSILSKLMKFYIKRIGLRTDGGLVLKSAWAYS